jgi:hypothetical protein
MRFFEKILGAAIAACLCAGSAPAAAQVNAEALRSTLRNNPRFLWLEGALVGRTGNTQTMTFGGSAFAGLTSDPHLFFMKVGADYGEARGQTTVARSVAHARYNYRLGPILALEALAQVQHDRFRRIEVRDLYGAGLRFHVYEVDDLAVFTGTTYLLEHEVIGAIPGSERTKEIWNRSSNYAGLNARLAPFIEASTVTYFQPRFDEPTDFRILSDSYVSFTISKLLSARVSVNVWYDSDPPPGVRTYDVEIKNSLGLKLD